MLEKLYTVEEVAESFQFEPAYIRREIRNDQLEAFRFGRTLRISEFTIQEWLRRKSTFSPALQKADAEDRAKLQAKTE